MPLLIVLLALCAVLCWMWRSKNAIRWRTSGPDADRRARVLDVFGTRVERVGDPRLAATILMLQLVRTGSPLTAAEKTTVMELVENPLGIASIETIFVRAWSYTDGSRMFSPVADDLVPMLRRQLSAEERVQLVDMLRKVAGAYGKPSELQIEAIDRLQRRLAASGERPLTGLKTPIGD